MSEQRERERHLTPELLESMLTIRLSGQATLGDLSYRLSSGSRIVFVILNQSEVVFGRVQHGELEKELGINEHKDLYIKGVVQVISGRVRVNCDDYATADKMYNTEDGKSDDYLEVIKKKIRHFLFK